MNILTREETAGEREIVITGELAPGQSVIRLPKAGFSAGPPRWRKPLPIIPCTGVSWGFSGEAAQRVFLVDATSLERAAYASHVLAWAFERANAPVIVSIETINADGPTLNLFTSSRADARILKRICNSARASAARFKTTASDVECGR